MNMTIRLGGHPYMPSTLYEYCERYFKTVGATILPSDENALCVEITRDVDKELTDRPFYWMWVEAMNENPPNTILYLQFKEDIQPQEIPKDAKPELITPGCYRLMRIYASAKTRGAFAAAYENQSLLSPYAIFIVRVSFVSDRRIDFLESYAIDLTTLQVYGDVITRLNERNLLDERPLHAQILPVPLDMDQLFSLLLQCVRLDVQDRDHTWATEAHDRLQDELQKLDQYYNSLSSRTSTKDPSMNLEGEGEGESDLSIQAERELRRAELIWRTEPKIEVRPQQMALAYLASPPV